MLITFTGSHCTGKTTLLKELQKQECLKDFTFVDEVTRKLPRNKINKNGTDETQLTIMNMHIENSKLPHAILDRGSFDGDAYTSYLRKYGDVSLGVQRRCRKIHCEVLKKYDLVFYLPIEIELVSDGVREDKDPFFRKWIDSVIRANTLLFDDHYKLVEVRGTVKERVRVCMDAIEELREK